MIRFGSLIWGGATLAILLGCYTVSLKVSGERKAVDDLRTEIASNERGIRTLEAEYRTRARLSELQRWNDVAFQLKAASVQQFVRDPVQLAAFETLKPALPEPRFAVAEASPKTLPAVQETAYQPQPAPARAPVIAAAGDLVGPTLNGATLQRVALR